MTADIGRDVNVADLFLEQGAKAERDVDALDALLGMLRKEKRARYAALAGLLNGDLIVGFDGKPVNDDRALPRIVADTPIGKTVSIDVLRKNRKATYHIQIAKLDEGPPDKPGPKMPPPPPRKPS